MITMCTLRTGQRPYSDQAPAQMYALIMKLKKDAFYYVSQV